ncbi:MAG: hypothetical protein ACJAWV_004117 [Flammeovirgaceae bacterium]
MSGLVSKYSKLNLESEVTMPTIFVFPDIASIVSVIFPSIPSAGRSVVPEPLTTFRLFSPVFVTTNTQNLNPHLSSNQLVLID